MIQIPEGEPYIKPTEKSVTLSIIIPTIARATLCNTLASLRGQILPGDEVIVEFDSTSDPRWDTGATKDYTLAGIARDRGAARSKGSHLIFIDDDDAFLPGVFESIRREVEAHPNSLLIFQTLFNGGDKVKWEAPEFAGGQCPTPSLILPRSAWEKSPWTPIGHSVHQDLAFAMRCATATHPYPPVWIALPIAIARPVRDDDPVARSQAWFNNRRGK